MSNKIDIDTLLTLEARAEDVLKEVYGESANIRLPIDPTRLAKQFGLTVYESNFFDNSISGLYDKDKKEIHVAQGEYLPRQLFTIAHEIAHFFLHRQKNEIFYRKDTVVLGEKPKTETEADYFASVILMPKVLVKAYWEITKDTRKLATVFGVSESAIRWRLHNLGLKNNVSAKN